MNQWDFLEFQQSKEVLELTWTTLIGFHLPWLSVTPQGEIFLLDTVWKSQDIVLQSSVSWLKSSNPSSCAFFFISPLLPPNSVWVSTVPNTGARVECDIYGHKRDLFLWAGDFSKWSTGSPPLSQFSLCEKGFSCWQWHFLLCGVIHPRCIQNSSVQFNRRHKFRILPEREIWSSASPWGNTFKFHERQREERCLRLKGQEEAFRSREEIVRGKKTIWGIKHRMNVEEVERLCKIFFCLPQCGCTAPYLLLQLQRPRVLLQLPSPLTENSS